MMGGKTVSCVGVIVLCFATASSYVVVLNAPDPYNSVAKEIISEDDTLMEGNSSNIENESRLNNWYNSDGENEAICGTVDKGYKFFESTQSCYKVHSDSKTWTNAQATCSHEGATLAVINSRDEAQILAEQFPDGSRVIYIGVMMIQDLQLWVTLSGQTLAEAGYENWGKGSPSNTGEKYCGSMYSDGSLEDIDCTDENAFICEIKAISFQPNNTAEAETEFDTTTETIKEDSEESSSVEASSSPTSVEERINSTIYSDLSEEISVTESSTEPTATHNECGTNYTEYQLHVNSQTYYKVHTENKTWKEAEETCVDEGGHLAFLKNRDDRKFFMTCFPPASAVWLGFHHNGESWMTVHGQPLNEAGIEPIDSIGRLGSSDCGGMYQFYSEGVITDIPCYFAFYFICERDTDSQSPLDATEIDNKSAETESLEAHDKCGTTDTEYKYLESTKACYKVHTRKESWQHAEDKCVEEGGHLAVINSQNEADFFMRLYPEDASQIFLGFYHMDWSWMTVNGQSLAETGYVNWNEGEPNNINGRQYCGSMYANGKFDDIDCPYTLAYICERNPNIEHNPDITTTEAQSTSDTSDKDNGTFDIQKSSGVEDLLDPIYNEDDNKCGTTDTEYKYLESTKGCYKVHTRKESWQHAEDKCIEDGGHLAVINSQDEAEFLMKLFPPDSYQVFLGFRKWCLQCSWDTINGQTLEETGYVNWNEGEPNNISGDQFCGTMYANGKFDDLACFLGLAFICERNATFDHEPELTTEVQITDTSKKEDAFDVEVSSGMDDLLEPTFNKDENKCGEDTEYTFYESTQSYYKIHTDRATWVDAAAACVREGGHLAVINSQDEADILTKMYPENAENVFLGHYRNSLLEDGIRLTNECRLLSETVYYNWSQGEPNLDGSIRCGTFYRDGMFGDDGSYRRFQYICEINP